MSGADTGRFAAVRLASAADVRRACADTRAAALDTAARSEAATQRQREAARAALDALERAALAGRNCVLIVEDDPGASWALERMLALDGWAVELVATGELALERLAGGAYEVALVDRLLPGAVQGDDVAVYARARGCRVVLTSGVDPDELERAARVTAAHAIVPKPVRRAELLAAMRPPEVNRGA